MAMGRPLKFKDAEELYNKGIEHIENIIKEGKNLTYTGLCIALDTSKDVLDDYANGKHDTDNNNFSYSVKRLKLHCEQFAENKLFGNNPTGAIFALKNYGWKDKIETENLNKNLNDDVSSMSDEELEREYQRLKALNGE